MITGRQVAEKAKSLLLMGTIPYALGGEDPKTGLDCQGLVEWTLRELGIKSDYKGTNHMWRNLLTDKGSIEDGVGKYGGIPLGALIFICDYGTIPGGYSDAPDCEHIYVKIADGMLIHASQGNRMVCTRTFEDKTIPNGGPTHYGLIKGVDYGIPPGDANNAEEAAPAVTTWKPRYTRLIFKYTRKDDGSLLCMGDGVREIQTGLNRLGYALTVDGEFGPLTAEAVKDFQRAYNLEDDGVVGELTWEALIKAANSDR